MYRIKPNGNYNLVIADINVSINAIQVEGKEVDKKLFDSSSDAKRLVDSKLLLVEDANVAKKQAAQTKVDKDSNKEKVFVVEGSLNETPSGVFIKDVPENKNKKNVEVKQVESLTKDTEDKTSTSKAKVTVAEPKVSKEVENNETKDAAKEEDSNVKTSNEDKKSVPATKKPAPKNTKTTK